MNKKNCGSAVTALLFAGMLAFLSLWNILLPQREFSPMENRELALFPAVSAAGIKSGKWMSAFETFSADQFLFRDGFMRIKTAADLALQKEDNGRVYFGRDGYLFSIDSIDGKQANANLALTANFIRRAKEKNPSLRTSVLLAPTAHSVLADKLPVSAPVPDEKAALFRAFDFLKEQAPDTVLANPFSALEKAEKRQRDEYGQGKGPEGRSGEGNAKGQAGAQGDNPIPDPVPQLYYRTDHHWTTDGAYIAYRQWAEEYGLVPYGRELFRREAVTQSFYGTNQSKAPGVMARPDFIVRYVQEKAAPYKVTIWRDIAKPDQPEIRDSLYDDGYLSGKDKYGYFLGGNQPQLRIETPVKNGRRLLLVKDSYANCMVPFLALHFEEIYITDLRYSHGKLVLPPGPGQEREGEGFGKDGINGITDIMFLYNIQSFSTDRNLAYLARLIKSLQWEP